MSSALTLAKTTSSVACRSQNIHPTAGDDFQLWRSIVLIGFAAFLLRVFGMIFFTGTIGTEGAEYARIAENLLAGSGYVGIANEGTELMFPPLFPFMIAALSLVTHNVEIAGRLVSVIMGTVLVIYIHLFTWRVYGSRVANVAGALAVLQPLLVLQSTIVFCETTYAAFIFSGIYWIQRSYTDRNILSFMLAGSSYGLAYLTRPEAVLFPFITAILVVASTILTKHRDLRRIVSYTCLLVVISLVLAAPYVGWVSRETGHFRIEGKGPIIYAMDHGIVSGRDPNEVQYGISDDLKKEGVWMASNGSVIRATAVNGAGLVALVQAGLKNCLPIVARKVTLGLAFGSLLFFGLAIFGILRTRWSAGTINDQLLLFMTLGVTFCSLLTHPFNPSARYLFLFLPVMLIWASKGIVDISLWLCHISRNVKCFDVSWRGSELAVQSAIALPVLLIALFGVLRSPHEWGIDSGEQPIKIAGEWLDRYSPGPKIVMDNNTLVAFHARASYLHFPYANESLALRFIAHYKVKFLVLMSKGFDPSFIYLKKWMESGIPDPRARLIYSAESPLGGRIAIYEWSEVKRESGGPERTQETAWQAVSGDQVATSRASCSERGTSNFAKLRMIRSAASN